MLKYKFNLKDISLADFKVYLVAMFKAVLPKSKLRNLDDLKKFIQQKSAWVTQVTLYNYLKTRMEQDMFYILIMKFFYLQ